MQDLINLVQRIQQSHVLAIVFNLLCVRRKHINFLCHRLWIDKLLLLMDSGKRSEKGSKYLDIVDPHCV